MHNRSDIVPAREQWRPVSGYTGIYEVSDRGRIRRIVRMNRWPAGGIVKSSPNADGYPSVYLRHGDGTKRRRLAIHRLVLEAFVRLRGPGEQCRHLDGDPQNSCLKNLRWGSSQENSDDKTRHGRAPLGTSNHRAISRQTARRIYRRLRGKDCRQRHGEIAAEFGVSRATVQRIDAGNHWIVG